jgi:hypothetical protein
VHRAGRKWWCSGVHMPHSTGAGVGIVTPLHSPFAAVKGWLRVPVENRAIGEAEGVRVDLL